MKTTQKTLMKRQATDSGEKIFEKYISDIRLDI